MPLIPRRSSPCMARRTDTAPDKRRNATLSARCMAAASPRMAESEFGGPAVPCYELSAGDPLPRKSTMQVQNDVVQAIGNTPLIKLRKVSQATGCTILGKAEFLNPGQSVKDRPARQ